MSEIGYTLIRSDRKTTAIRVLTDGSVEVRAPRRLPVGEIERFLVEKSDWIQKHRQIMQERYPADLDPRKILYKGNWKTIQPTEDQRLLFDGEFFYAPADWTAAELKATLPDLMKKLAKAYLIPIAMQKAAKMGLQPERITITGAKTKWGSCSNGKNINFSWRLLSAPTDTIEYVILHELCHMQEMNHGPAFWALLNTCCPEWRRHRDTLAEVQSWLDAYYR